ncbi:uncharacterized protein BP5553_05560 [Venustampulla echinocandica]|uniref:DUF7582 domain-containing protein n=1 Tax=Venustampulla echinocandica TaxID=2656787 RepID=A0A370TRG0_9HELO|nr:uncharacterized protein BP5553_05560 [Venustampulla echinocandica]RDL38127.1 hypothetical protein BP5553_05560 [Venustampulla echinocandica]
MPIIKDCISPPLEAGSSLLDAKQLPTVLISALEYVSSRLARKRLHISLIVIRKEVQVPVTPSDSSSSVTTSAAQSLFSRSSSSASSASSRSLGSSSSCSSLSSSTCSSSSSLSRTQYPSLPSSPKDSTAVPKPRIRIPSSSSPALPCSTPTAPNQYGISLLHASSLTPKAEKILRQTILKAEKKFPIGSGWLSPKPLTSSSKCAATNDLIRRSLQQNEILFSSEGLSLLSLDHVYTFKCQLHTYSRTLTPSDLTLAVDELQRLVLLQQGRRITKGYLMRAYDWLGVSLAALVDVNEGYKTAYGGCERRGGIEVVEPETRTQKQLPQLQLQTSFTKPTAVPSFSVRMSIVGSRESEASWFSEDDETPLPLSVVEVGESAKGTDLLSAVSCQFDLERVAAAVENRGPHLRGPLTPNTFEDITPVTQGEWCFLMVGNVRRGPVETC